MIEKGIKIIILQILLISCSNKNKTSIYLMPYLESGQKIQLVINDGDYTFEKTYKYNYSNDESIFIKNYKNPRDSLKIYFKTFDRDTTVYLSPNTEQILLGFNIDKEIFIYTEKDSIAWNKY